MSPGRDRGFFPPMVLTTVNYFPRLELSKTEVGDMAIAGIVILAVCGAVFLAALAALVICSARRGA